MPKSEAISKQQTEIEQTEIENFAELLDESLDQSGSLEGAVLEGKIISIENEYAIVDVGLKSEGRVHLHEFSSMAESDDIKTPTVGDEVRVYVERIEDKNGEISLSREKARREEAWVEMEKAHEKNERVNGVIFGRVKGGFTVDLNGAIAFLPGSQVDFRPIKDISPLMGVMQPFQILKMDRQRGNIVVSRRSILEESRAEARSELVSNMSEGQVLKGIVKNITDYGAFIDLGGVDGLLHVTDISWKRINNPSEVLKIGDTVEVQVIRFNKETQRISLGMKQLHDDPWGDIEQQFPLNEKVTGRVTNITDYGAFVELQDGVEGLIHVSEMSWVKKNLPPQKLVSVSQEVEVRVLDIDKEKRRISLGLKQCQDNPWEKFATNNNEGDVVEGEVKNITEFGLFVGLDGELDGMVHLSDLSWEEAGEKALESYNKGDVVKCKILEIDTDKERICLGIKQLTNDPFEGEISSIKKGDVVTCTITEIASNGLNVRVGENLTGFIRKGDLSRDRSEQRLERFAVDEKIDAKVTSIDKSSRKLNLSIKSREISEEKQAMEQYGSSDSGASLGDILGAALEGAKDKDDASVAEEKAETKKKATTKKATAKEEKADDSAKETKAKKEKASDEAEKVEEKAKKTTKAKKTEE